MEHDFKEDLEHLFKEKDDLDDESRRLDAEQEKLNLREKVLLGEFVREARKKNSEKQQANAFLREQIAELETQLGIGELFRETKVKNGEKRQEITHLKEQIAGLEAQLKEFSVSDVEKDHA